MNSLRRAPRLALGLALAALAGCSINPVSGRPELDLVSDEEEERIGREEHDQIVRELGLVPDEELRAYVQGLVDRLGRASETPSARFRVYLLDDPEVNAVALPGGYVYATRGLLAFLESEAALAVVLGHELGHVVARHAERCMSRRVVLGFPWDAIELVFPRLVKGLGVLVSPATGLLRAAHSRAQEEEADELGLRYAHALGYDAHAVESFFLGLERLERSEEDGEPSWYSTHPATASRREAARAQAQALQPPGEERELGRHRYLDAIAGLVYGRDPRDGVLVEGRFVHPRARASFPVPAGWSVHAHRDRALLSSPEGDAFLLLRPSRASSLEDFRQRAQRRQDVQVVGVLERRVGDFQALRLEAHVTTQDAQLTTLSTVFASGGRLWELHEICARERFSAHVARFRELANGLSRVEDPRLLRLRPTRVVLARPPQGAATFADLLEAYPVPPGATASEVALLNRVEASTPLEPGRRYKVLVVE